MSVFQENKNLESDLSMGFKRLRLYLIKPSKYDEEGYVIRHWKGVLPSNTLSCLYGLSEDVRERGVLGSGLEWDVYAIDETVQRVDTAKIIRQSKDKHTKTLVCLVGVQSNQFARASDIALALRRAGVDVLIGGFHVSGVLALLEKLPAEVAQLVDAGVSLFGGEAEGRWELVLRDALRNELKPIYNYLKEVPDLSTAPLPRIPQGFQNKYAVSHFATLDCGRGCPYACSFCTVINVQGRAMRVRPVEAITRMIRENFLKHNISYYFFTDDNFSRNKNWRPIFDSLIHLKNNEGIPLRFMMQVDTQSHKIADFVQKAAEAGCSQVFIGLESINEENLQAAGKKQNKVGEFRAMIDLYQEAGISAHLAYIIGFPFDTKESVARDMERLQGELGARQASFFMLTPLPGSMDHKHAVANGMMMDTDMNNFDSFHETFKHQSMGGGTWTETYAQAWKTFYSTKNMIRVLKELPSKKYWDVFLNFIWYKNAIQVEGGHPMLHGFLRLKHRDDRRPIFAKETRFQFFKRRMSDLVRNLRGWLAIIIEMEEVWLATRQRGPLEEKVLQDLAKFQDRAKEWRHLRLTELQALYRDAASELTKFGTAQYAKIPSRIQLWWRKRKLSPDSLTCSRAFMTQFWKSVFSRESSKKTSPLLNFPRAAAMMFRECILFVHLGFAILSGSGVLPGKK